MALVRVTNTLVTVTETGFVTEASTAGLKPGEWPSHIAVVEPTDRNLGVIFHKSAPILHHGEFHGFVYAAQGANTHLSLTVIND